MEKLIIDNNTLIRTIRRLSYEIIEKHDDLKNVVLIGIKTKGILLSEMIQKNIEKIEGLKLETGSIDISNYRDDVIELDPSINNRLTTSFDVNNKTVVLVDDVLFTGRTIRAAMDAIIDLGRPKVIELLVLVDRGHRQFPIRANYIGKNIPTSNDELVKVIISDTHDENKVLIIK